MVRARPLLLTLLLLAAPRPSAAGEPPPPGMDPAAGRVCAVGLARLGTDAASLSRSVAVDVATHDARLGLRRLLYGLPVLEGTTLAAALIRSSTLAAGLERVIDAAPVVDSRMVPPDLIEARVQLDLAALRRTLAPLLLARDGEAQPPAPAAPPTAPPPAPSPTVAILPPSGAGYAPALLPLLGSRDSARALRLRRALGNLILRGGTILHPARDSSVTRDAAVRIEADAVGGLGRGTLYLTDRDADRVIEALESETPPALALVTEAPQKDVAADSAR